MNKKIIIILCMVIVVVLIGVYFLFFSTPSKNRLTKHITEMGQTFYTNFYNELNEYLVEEKVQEEVSKLSLLGMQISLNNLKDNQDNEKLIKKFRKCDHENTIVTIFPKEPFGINDYRYEVKLDCK